MRIPSSIFAGAFLLLTVTVAYADQFCDGFEVGTPPDINAPPDQVLIHLHRFVLSNRSKNLMTPNSDFEHGYIIGFEQGQIRGRR